MSADKKKAEAAPDDAAAGTKSSKKIVLIIGAVVLAAVAAGGGWFFASKKKPDVAHEEAAEAEEHAEKPEKGKKGKPKKEKKEAKQEEEGGHGGGKKEEIKGLTAGPDGTAFYELPTFLVNLNAGDGKRTSFLKITVSLELEDEDDVGDIELVKPKLIDTFNVYLRELRPADMSGSAGIYRLREELLVRVNKTTAPIKVTDILFNEIIVQ